MTSNILRVIVGVALAVLVGAGVYFTNANRREKPLPQLPYEGRLMVDLTVPERIEYNDTLRALDAETLFRVWKDSKEKTDYLRTDFIANALASKLQTELVSETLPVYKAISSFIADKSNDENARMDLIQTLGQTVTPQSLDIILGCLKTGKEEHLVGACLGAVHQVSVTRWGGSFHEELSPPLEEFLKANTDRGYLSVITYAIAQIGAPSGIEFLLKSVLVSGKTTADFEKLLTRSRALYGSVSSGEESIGNFPTYEEELAGAARYALQDTRNPKAIPILKRGLRNQQPDDLELVVSGEALAAMGDAEATKAILEWAKGRDASVAPLVEEWIGKMRDTNSVLLVKETVASGKSSFKSAEVWGGVNSAFDVYNGVRSENLRP